MSYVDADNDWIPEVARAALDAEYNRPSSWAVFAAEGSEAAQAEVEIWKRLANDEVMKDVYENLEAVPGFDEHQLADFLDAAWGARMDDLQDVRKGRLRTLELVPEIGEKALELKALIEQLDGSMVVPSELSSVVSLLRSAEEQPPWPCRQYMVGEKLSESVSGFSDERAEAIRLDKVVNIVHKDELPATAVTIEFVEDDEIGTPLPQRPELDPGLLLVNGNKAQGWRQAEGLDPAIWKGAPTVVDLLQAMADAAEDWKQQADEAKQAAEKTNHDEVQQDVGERKTEKKGKTYIWKPWNPDRVFEAAVPTSDTSAERTQYMRALVASLRDRGIMVRKGNPPTALKRACVYVAHAVVGYTDVEPYGNNGAFEKAVNRAIKGD